MKKAIIIDAFDNYCYDVRVKYLERFLKKLNYNYTVYSSDFNHRTKEPYNLKRKNLVLVSVPRYKKNLSFSRIYSHYKFSSKVAKIIKKENPNLVYVIGPPNFLFKNISKIKHRNFKLIFDIGDMWPETLPVSNKLKLLLMPILCTWGHLRNAYLKYADAVLYECDLFKNNLSKYSNQYIKETIYLCKENYKTSIKYNDDNEVLNFLYLGSINNIIEIDLMINLLVHIKNNKKVILSIIGDGENKNNLLRLCKQNDINYIDYGCIYDDNKKYEIIKNCQFSLNLMKKSVVVGITMKSLEYFHWGTILINNIGIDTKKIIDNYNCGFDLSYDNVDEISKKICNLDSKEILRMRNNSRKAYLDNFSEIHLEKKFIKIIKEIENEK